MKNILRIAAAGVALLSAIALGACSEKTEYTQVLSEIGVTVAKPTVAIADTVRATAVGLDQRGESMPVGDVTWSAQGAATVSQTGLITGVQLGTAIVRVTVAGRPMFAEVNVTVGPKPAVQLRGGLDIVAARGKTFAAFASLTNADGLLVRQAGIPITVSMTGGGTLSGTLTGTTDQQFGTVAFSNLSIDGPSGVRTLTFSSPGLVSGTSKVTVVSGVASKIELVSGGNQTSPKGLSTMPLGFRVTDADGYPVAGVPVTFTITSGTGSLGQQNAVTGEDGTAGPGQWLLNSLGAHTMRATAQGVTTPATASATATPRLTVITINLSAPQVAVGQSIKATVSGVDDAGAPYLPATSVVEWIPDGRIMISADGVITGVSAGQSSLIARIDGLPTSVSFAVTGSATRALRILTFPASVTSGAALTTEPSVQIVDTATSLPVAEAGRVVTASVVGPLLTPEATSLAVNIVNGSLTAVTDNTGVARFPGLSTIARSRRFALVFRSDGILPVQSGLAVVLAGAPAGLQIHDGNNQSAVTQTTVATPPTVRVIDSAGNSVAGATVTFTIGTGAGSIVGATATTDADGRASVGSWKLGAVGTNTLVASSPGVVGTVTFTATARPF